MANRPGRVRHSKVFGENCAVSSPPLAASARLMPSVPEGVTRQAWTTSARASICALDSSAHLRSAAAASSGGRAARSFSPSLRGTRPARTVRARCLPWAGSRRSRRRSAWGARSMTRASPLRQCVEICSAAGPERPWCVNSRPSVLVLPRQEMRTVRPRPERSRHRASMAPVQAKGVSAGRAGRCARPKAPASRAVASVPPREGQAGLPRASTRCGAVSGPLSVSTRKPTAGSGATASTWRFSRKRHPALRQAPSRASVSGVAPWSQNMRPWSSSLAERPSLPSRVRNSRGG